MPAADPRYPASAPAPETADDLDHATLIIRRGAPRHVAAAPTPSSESAPSAEPDDDQTRIVQRTTDEHTCATQRKPTASRPGWASEAPSDDADPTDSTVRSARGGTSNDTLLSGRRAASAAPTPVVDALQRRYEPPQVRSGSSVRYAARPTLVIVEASASASANRRDPARIALAAEAARIRQRTLAQSRRRRRLTLTAIVTSTLLVLLGAAAFTAFAVMTW